MQHDDALSQWLHPSQLPQSYLALLNEEEEEEEEATPVVKPSLDYAVKKVVLPSRDAAATGARGEVRTIYSASNETASSVVKPSIRVQSCTNNEELSVSILQKKRLSFVYYLNNSCKYSKSTCIASFMSGKQQQGSCGRAILTQGGGAPVV